MKACVVVKSRARVESICSRRAEFVGNPIPRRMLVFVGRTCYDSNAWEFLSLGWRADPLATSTKLHHLTGHFSCHKVTWPTKSYGYEQPYTIPNEAPLGRFNSHHEHSRHTGKDYRYRYPVLVPVGPSCWGPGTRTFRE